MSSNYDDDDYINDDMPLFNHNVIPINGLPDDNSFPLSHHISQNAHTISDVTEHSISLCRRSYNELPSLLELYIPKVMDDFGINQLLEQLNLVYHDWLLSQNHLKKPNDHESKSMENTITIAASLDKAFGMHRYQKFLDNLDDDEVDDEDL